MIHKTHVLLKREFIAHLAALNSTEAKVYVAILILADTRTGKLTIPLKGLANRIGLSYRMTNQAVLRLKEMKQIRYTHDRVMKESRIEITDYRSVLELESMNDSHSEPTSVCHSEPPSERHTEPTSECYKEPASQCHTEVTSVSDQTEPTSVRNPLPCDTQNRTPVQPNARVIIYPAQTEPTSLCHTEPPSECQADSESKNMLIENIAQEFKESISTIQSLCEPYPPEIIQKAFAESKRTPDDQIKKSRNALFGYLLKKYAD